VKKVTTINIGSLNQTSSGIASPRSLAINNAPPQITGNRKRVGIHHTLLNPTSTPRFNNLKTPLPPSFRKVREMAATNGPHAAGLFGDNKKSVIIEGGRAPLMARASGIQKIHVNPYAMMKKSIRFRVSDLSCDILDASTI
jgi:hypothetical protein